MPCGTGGAIGKNASFFVYHLLLQEQHRGEDTTKILSFDKRHYEHGGVGKVNEVFNRENLSKLRGNYAIGQVRYPTVGVYDDNEQKLRDAPPLWEDYPCFISLSHNGDMPQSTYENLRKKLEEDRFYFKTDSDLEIIEKLFSKGLRKSLKEKKLNNEDIFSAAKFMMERAPAAYAVTGIVTKGNERRLIGFTDPQKIRPLVFGKNKNLQVLASETAAIDVLSNYVNEKFETFELQGGEVIIAEEGREPVKKILIETEPKHCFFEYTYFARPDSRKWSICL
jgi:amidophosphoribosyltransferase